MVKISNQSLGIIILATTLACSGRAQNAKPDQKSDQNPSSAAAPSNQNATPQPAAAPKPGTAEPAQKDQAPAAQPAEATKNTAQTDAAKAQPKAGSSSADGSRTETAAGAAAAARRPLLSRSDAEITGLGEGQLPGTISIASKDTDEHTARTIAGRMVRGSDGKRLGKIKDLLLEPRSGEVPYAVISSGGLFARDRLVLVPFKALKRDSNHPDDFAVAMNEDQWKELHALGEEEFKSDHITLTDTERRTIARRFGQAQSGSEATGSDFYTENINSYLVRAEEIRRRNVYAGENSIGEIKDVVVDPTYSTAFALFDPSSRFSTGKQKFIVPLNRYSFGASKHDRVTARLERADLDRMRDITDPSYAVGPNADAANKGAPRQGVAVQEKGNPAVMNAKEAAVATGSFGGATTAAPSTGAVAQTSGSAAQSDRNGQSKAGQTSSDQSGASKNSDQTKATAGNSSGGGTASGSVAAKSDNANPSAQAGEQSKSSGQATTSNPKAGQATAANSAEAAKQKNGESQKNDTVAQTGDTSKANTNPKAGQSSNISPDEKTGPAVAGESKAGPQQKSDAEKSQALEPTGRTNPDPNAPAGESLSAARSVRQLLDQESAEIARLEVSVDPSSGALVLKGSVADEEIKKSIEEKVRNAAKGAKIDSQITVEKK